MVFAAVYVERIGAGVGEVEPAFLKKY